MGSDSIETIQVEGSKKLSHGVIYKRYKVGKRTC